MSRRFTLHGSRLLPLAVVAAAGILSGACRQDMHQAPRYDPLEESAVFPGGAASQPLVEGTIARGHLDDDELLYTGKVNGQVADMFPFEITAADLDRGQQRFNIYCSPCHGRTGEGNGMVVQRGFRQAANLPQRAPALPAGQIFDTITNGFGAMLDYKAQIQPEDRWRIVAYLRALQLSHHATTADVPADHLKDLEAPAPGAPAAEGKSGETK